MTNDLIKAIKSGNLGEVKLLLSSNIVGDNKDEALITASSYDQVEIVKFLLDNGADVHYEEEQALRTAVLYNKLNAVKILLENGADITELVETWARFRKVEIINCLDNWKLIKKLEEI
jgi:ankyrin repeat protein